jgi:iron(III) transport system permease protein
MASMASFSAPFIFGGSERFLTTEIYYAKINGDTSFSALIALLLAIISIIVLMLLNIYRKKIPAVGKSKGTARVRPLSIYSQNKWMINLVVYLFCLAIILPVLSLFIISLMPEGALMQSAENYHFTFENYSKLFSSNDFVEPFLTSVYTSVIAVLFTLFLGVVIALIGRGKSNWFTSTLETIVSIPYGIPGTVIAVGLILCFNSPVIFSFNTILIGTFWILPIAYTIRNLPILTQSVKNGLAAIDPSIEEASSSLGAGRFKTFLAITLPIVLPSIAEGALLVFINSFGEFVATVLLYSYSTKTLSIEVYAQMRLYNNAMAATYGMVIFLIVLSMVYLSRWMLNKRYYQK